MMMPSNWADVVKAMIKEEVDFSTTNMQNHFNKMEQQLRQDFEVRFEAEIVSFKKKLEAATFYNTPSNHAYEKKQREKKQCDPLLLPPVSPFIEADEDATSPFPKTPKTDDEDNNATTLPTTPRTPTIEAEDYDVDVVSPTATNANATNATTTDATTTTATTTPATTNATASPETKADPVPEAEDAEATTSEAEDVLVTAAPTTDDCKKKTKAKKTKANADDDADMPKKRKRGDTAQVKHLARCVATIHEQLDDHGALIGELQKDVGTLQGRAPKTPTQRAELTISPVGIPGSCRVVGCEAKVSERGTKCDEHEREIRNHDVRENKRILALIFGDELWQIATKQKWAVKIDNGTKKGKVLPDRDTGCVGNWAVISHTGTQEVHTCVVLGDPVSIEEANLTPEELEELKEDGFELDSYKYFPFVDKLTLKTPIFMDSKGQPGPVRIEQAKMRNKIWTAMRNARKANT